MENAQFEISGDVLTVRIDLSQELGLSASGKSVIIASTGGNISVPGHEEIKIGLNVYRPVSVQRETRRSRSVR